jgi:hypothetical protein
MQPASPLPVNQVVPYRPPCSKCGLPMTLACIKPSAKPDHDERTFECVQCWQQQIEVVRFK